MPRPGVDELADGVLRGDATLLSRAITLVESNAPAHQQDAVALLHKLMPRTGRAKRIGITGVPGVGKSTFIESFGLHLCRDHQLKTAVLAIDPSSTRTGGSILGDKTRMEELSRHPLAFIRPSPSGGTLGGVTRKTRESLLLCEAAGCEVVLVETVGAGQSETTVRSMVDFFLVLMLPNAGDELQGIKKGILEMADALLVNKADLDPAAAERARVQYQSALHGLGSPTPGWKPVVAPVSALKNQGVAEAWKLIVDFYGQLEPRGVIDQRRKEQNVEWMHAMLREGIDSWLRSHPGVRDRLPELEQAVASGQLPPREAAERILSFLT